MFKFFCGFVVGIAICVLMAGWRIRPFDWQGLRCLRDKDEEALRKDSKND